MAKPKLYVDGKLVNWADKLFFEPYKRPRGQGANLALIYLALRGLKKAEHTRAQIDRTTGRTPEVMVKITNKKDAGRGMAAIRRHLEYISRNGKLEIEDQNQDVYHSGRDLQHVKEFWQVSGRRKIAEDGVKGRGPDAVNVIFSMAPGTPALDVKDAVREFLGQEFAGREYLFVLHTDTAHPHVHVCLKTEGTSVLPRLKHGKQELQRWREGFAKQLRARGIAANATPRATRGQSRFPVPLPEYHRRKRRGIVTPPAPTVSPNAYLAQRKAWRNMAQALGESELESDVQLAHRIVAFWRTTPAGMGNAARASALTTAQQEPDDHGRYTKNRLTDRWRAAARLGFASLYQSHAGKAGAGQEAPAVSGLRHMSSIDVVHKKQRLELLLQPDARDYLERQGRGGRQL